MQDDTAHQLYAEGFHVQGLFWQPHAPWHKPPEAGHPVFPLRETLPEFLRLILQLFIGKLHHRGP